MADNNEIEIPASWTPVLDFLQPVETCLSKVLTLGGLLFNRAVIFFIGVVAIGVKTFCGFKLKNATTATKALVLVFSSVSLLCLALFSLGTHIFFCRLLHLADTRFPSLAVLVKTPLMIAVIFGLGYLSKFLEKNDGWNIYAVIFYQCIFVLVTCVMKLLRRGDALGVGGGIIAISAYLFIIQKPVTPGPWIGYIIGTYIVFLFRNVKYHVQQE